MKCTQCGLPLSPHNTPTVCPRCHATTQAGQAGSRLALTQTPPPFHPHNMSQRDGFAGTPVPVQTSSPTSSSPQWNSGTQHNQFPFPPVIQQSFPSSGQLWNSAPPLTPGAIPTPFPTSPPTPVPFEALAPTPNNPYMAPRTPGVMYTPPTPPLRPRQQSNRGFFIAGFCVITGGLMLILVYILGLGLPPTTATTSLVGTPNVTKSILPSPTTVVQKPTVQPTPTTNAFPGQQYINNPQMASAVNINTAQPIQTTTIFHANQKIYVTFNLQPNGKNGAVCLYWYLNNHSITQYPFAVPSTARAAYSYAIYGSKGAAYVEIYWASTTSCSDRLLAQHVTFTVTA